MTRQSIIKIKESIGRLSPAQLQEFTMFVELLDGSRRLPPAKQKLFLEYLESKNYKGAYNLLKEESAIGA